MVKVIIKDIGKQEDMPVNITPLDIAKTINKKEPIIAKVNGVLWDLTRPLKGKEPILVEILTQEAPESLKVMRHSASHVMAGAIKRLFPQTRLAIGPPVEEGFFYDIHPSVKISEDDLSKIEEEMQKIINENFPFERTEISKKEAYELFKQKGETYKLEILNTIEDETVTIYTDGDFVDLCEGPHAPSTGYVKAFKLLSIAGAYWRGDEKNPMLLRIYGTAFFTKAQLDKYLVGIEEAKKRDHRKLGKELKLFSVHEEVGAGLIHWHPKGTTIIEIIQDYWKKFHIQNGYQLVSTPHIASEEIYKISGHLEKYADLMYASLDIEGRPFRIKPMNCPGHIMIYKTSLHSYKELPLRYAELGTVYRFEKKGVLHGLLRVRGFTIDDAHIFVNPRQVEEEVIRVFELAVKFLKKFGFKEFDICLSTRPEQSIGRDEDWKTAEDSLKTALENAKINYTVEEGGGAFYGPKIDIRVKDCLGRLWQCTTIQFDFNLPERFNLTFVDRDGKHSRPYMIHRALMGSIERFVGLLIEQYAGDFPLWFSPVQARVMSITEREIDYAKEVYQKLKENNIRSEIDVSDSRISLKIREAFSMKIPYMVIVGEKEKQNKNISVRCRKKGDIGVMTLEKFIEKIDNRIRFEEVL